jgi:hypothetical protein
MSDIITISDHIGRTVVGTKVSEDDTTLVLNNPIHVHVHPNAEDGNLQVQSLPYIFMELIKGDKDKNNWTFNKSSIVISDVELDDKLVQQVTQINTPKPPEADEAPEVVKLFDE